MYQTILTNFGNPVYEGHSFGDAKEAALKAGFEATIMDDNLIVATYSPIVGFVSYDNYRYQMPGAMAAEFAEENGIDYETALVMCNMD